MRMLLAVALVAVLLVPAIADADSCSCRPCCKCQDKVKLNFGVDMEKIGTRKLDAVQFEGLKARSDTIIDFVRIGNKDAEVRHYTLMAALAGLAVLQVVLAATAGRRS